MDPFTPLATLALVCNITQLVGQAIEGVRCCKELWGQGSLDKNNRVEACSVDIIKANDELDLALGPRPRSGRASRFETLAKEAVDTAKELRIELNKLKLSKAQGVKAGEYFKRALRTFVKGGSIRRLEENLERQESTLKSSLLKNLYIECGESDLTRRDEFQKLSQGQQDIITQVLHAQKLLSADLFASIKSSEANITSHFEREGAAQQAASAQERDQEEQRVLRRRLLDALAFPEMSDRRNMIEGRVADFGSTYSWVFGHTEHYRTDSTEDGTLSHKSYDSNYLDFVRWLQGDDGLFWISGKPGSGKSTLMDFVFHNLQKGGRGFDA